MDALGDLMAVCTAGAYGFVQASNYNSRPRPVLAVRSKRSSPRVYLLSRQNDGNRKVLVRTSHKIVSSSVCRTRKHVGNAAADDRSDDAEQFFK